MPHGRVLKTLVLISRIGLGLLFLVAGVSKIATAREFAASVSNLVWEGWSWPVALAVIAVELTAAALLLRSRTSPAGALLSAFLLAGFAGYALYYVYVLGGEPLECGCFGGIIASQLGVTTALRNLGLLIPALIVFFGIEKAEASNILRT